MKNEMTWNEIIPPTWTHKMLTLERTTELIGYKLSPLMIRTQESW